MPLAQNFDIKKSTIAKMHDLRILKVDELISLLRKYEMEMLPKESEKKILRAP